MIGQIRRTHRVAFPAGCIGRAAVGSRVHCQPGITAADIVMPGIADRGPFGLEEDAQKVFEESRDEGARSPREREREDEE